MWASKAQRASRASNCCFRVSGGGRDREETRAGRTPGEWALPPLSTWKGPFPFLRTKRWPQEDFREFNMGFFSLYISLHEMWLLFHMSPKSSTKLFNSSLAELFINHSLYTTQSLPNSTSTLLSFYQNQILPSSSDTQLKPFSIQTLNQLKLNLIQTLLK